MAGARPRRDFLSQGLRAGAALAASPLVAKAAELAPSGFSGLRRRYPDLERHFVFEYSPWYGGPPDYEHWDYLEQHARWIQEAGVGPVFKSLRTVLAEAPTDCLGETHPVSDFTSDAFWRRQTDSLREALRRDFDHVTLLADSLEFARTPASGFDGIGIYDNFMRPPTTAAMPRVPRGRGCRAHRRGARPRLPQP